MNHGVYAMVGAAAVLGMCRVTITLEVISLDSRRFTPALMLALLISKWVGDLFTGGICDMCIELRGYPFSHEEDKKPKKDKEKKDKKRKDAKHDKIKNFKAVHSRRFF